MEARVAPFLEAALLCNLAISTTRHANMSSPPPRPLILGSTTWALRASSSSSRTRRAGYCFYRDARLRRLLRYRYNNAPTDVGGRYFYIHDGGDYWTPSYMPVKTRAREVRVSARAGLHARSPVRAGRFVPRSLYFVPLGHTAEVHRVTLKNEGRPRRRSSSSRTSSSACGTRTTTAPTTSATSAPARSRWTAAPSTTRPNTASAATTSRFTT